MSDLGWDRAQASDRKTQAACCICGTTNVPGTPLPWFGPRGPLRAEPEPSPPLQRIERRWGWLCRKCITRTAAPGVHVVAPKREQQLSLIG